MNFSEYSSPSKEYDIFEHSFDKVLPLIFRDDNKEKIKDKSNEIDFPYLQDNQEKKKNEDINLIEKIQQRMKENIYLIRSFKEKK